MDPGSLPRQRMELRNEPASDGLAIRVQATRPLERALSAEPGGSAQAPNA